MTLTQIIAETENSLSIYADSNDVDRQTIKNSVIICLRQMGKNITVPFEEIVTIVNSKALLPENFKSLNLALKLEADAHSLNCDRKVADNSYIYRQRIENPAFYNQVTHEYETTCNAKIITERILLDNSGNYANFYYKPVWLSVTKGGKNEAIDSKSLNISPEVRNAADYQISITNRNLITNFRNGSIYIQYNGFPTDEYGDLLIPEFTTGDLVEYCKTHAKVALAEQLVLAEKAQPGLRQLYPVWKQEIPLLKGLALKECAFANLDKNWSKKMKALNKSEITRFNLPHYAK